MLEAWLSVKIVLEFDPECGMLPVPIHPVHTCLIPAVLEEGDVTDSVISVPASNHPLVGVGPSYCESTVK
jgi:hypothetical protein